MAATHEVRNISITIDRDWHEVYEFASIPENFPKWASGFAASIRKEGDAWVAEAPEGLVRVRFSDRNNFGVLDHDVSLSPEVEISMPARVVANGTGAEVIFTLFRLPDMTDEVFARDAEWIANDLRRLKSLLET